MSAQNGRASRPALEREDTPDAGLSMMPLVREAVAGGNLAQAILITANVTERCVTHSHLAAERAEVAVHESRLTRETAKRTEEALTEHRSFTKVELESLTKLVGHAPIIFEPRQSKSGEHTPAELTAMEQGSGVAGILGRLAADHSRMRADFTLAMKSEARWTRVVTVAVAAGILIIIEVLK